MGAGSWGTALAKLLADNRQEVLLYDRSPGTVEEINNQHSNLTKLANSYLPVTVKATTDLSEALSFSDILVLSVPTKVIRGVLAEIAKLLTSPKLFVNTSKGLEPETYKRVSEVTKEEIPSHLLKGFVALTGPSHAEEVIIGLPTSVCSVSENVEHAKLIQKIFSNTSYFRVYTLTGFGRAEWSGALKIFTPSHPECSKAAVTAITHGRH